MPAAVINADASQVYSDLRVVSARPSPSDEAQAPHHLFGYIDGAESCSAARWASDAKSVIAKTASAGRLPILVGGTGLYLRTLLDGIAPVPEIDPDIRAAVRAMPVEDAYQALIQEDAEAAARLAPQDTTRIARALEVVRATGRTLSAWQLEKRGGIGAQIKLTPVILLPDRPWLYARCDARFDAMLDNGAINEVEALLARELDPDLPIMRAIGVPELAAFIQGRLSRDAACEQGRQATRNYAKRQFTWFRNQSPPAWRRAEGIFDNALIDELAIKLRDEALT